MQEPKTEPAYHPRVSGTSNRGLHGKGGLQNGGRRPARATARGRKPLRGGRDSATNNGVAGGHSTVGSSPRHFQ